MGDVTPCSAPPDAHAARTSHGRVSTGRSSSSSKPPSRRRPRSGSRGVTPAIPTTLAAAALATVAVLLAVLPAVAGGPPSSPTSPAAGSAVAFSSPPAAGGPGSPLHRRRGGGMGDFWRARTPVPVSSTEMAASSASNDAGDPDAYDDIFEDGAAVRDNPNAFRFANLTPEESLSGDARGRKVLDDAIVRSLFAADSSSKPSLVIAGRGGGRRGGGGGVVASTALVDLHLAGYGTMKLSSPPAGNERDPNEGEGEGDDEEEVPCIFLTPEGGRTRTKQKFEAIAVPLSTQRLSRIRPLLEAARLSIPMSKTRCLALNPTLTNRDGGLFDGLPWDEWTVVNPKDGGRSTDAAGNLVENKYRKGKRDAFERFLGRDWPGRSLSVGNMALRALYALDGEGDDGDEDEVLDDGAAVRGGGGDVADEAVGDGDDDNNGTGGVATFDAAAGRVLAKRVLELELGEAESLLAEAEQKQAVDRIRRQSDDDDDDDDEAAEARAEAEARADADEGDGEDDMAECRDRIEGVRSALAALDLELDVPPPATAATSASTSSIGGGGDGKPRRRSVRTGSSLVRSILRDIADKSVYTFGTSQNNTAPYRGAYGYAPTLDSRQDYDAIYPYTGPFDLLLELIQTQLRATVIGVVLEDATLLRGVELGGAVVLRRDAPPAGSGGRTELFNGEKVDLPVEEVTEREVKTGDIRIVECYPEEAIGVALAVAAAAANGKGNVGQQAAAAGVVSVERGLFEGLSVTCDATAVAAGAEAELPIIAASGGDTIVRRSVPTAAEDAIGDGGGSSSSSSPKTTASFFSFGDDAGGGGIGTGGGNGMETINSNTGGGGGGRGGIVGAVPSVEAFDSLSVPDKARILLSVDSFKGRLPRPRVLRQSSSGSGGGSTGTKPLDDLLVPYLDESVRRAILIREAERAGDVETAAALRKERSARQAARERARALREEGVDEELVAAWEDEAEFRGDLRADVTQDVGSYSRFLDKDEWYERDRIATARRAKKSSFGTLLDGIE